MTTATLDDMNAACIARRMRRDRARLWFQICVTTFAMLLAFVCIASAEDMTIRFGTEGYTISGPHGDTIVAPLGSAAPRVISVPPGTIQWSTARKARWWLRCRPRLRMDDLGVERFVYAKAGCEFGADRDANFERETEPEEQK